MTCIRLSFSNFLVCHFWWLKNENPFNNKKLQFFRQPDPGHAQQSLAKFGHCGIWSYDLSLGLFFGGRWVEFLLSRKLPFWKHGSEIIELLLYHDHWGFAKRFFCFENLEKTDLLTCRVSLEIDHIAISKVKTLENSGKCRSIGWCKRTWRTLTGRTCWQLEHQKTEVVVSVFVYQRFSQDLPTKNKRETHPKDPNQDMESHEVEEVDFKDSYSLVKVSFFLVFSQILPQFLKLFLAKKSSGQFITTSAEVTPNGGLVRESPPKWP